MLIEVRHRVGITCIERHDKILNQLLDRVFCVLIGRG